MRKQISPEQAERLAKELRDAMRKRCQCSYQDMALESLEFALRAATRSQWNALIQHATLAAHWGKDALNNSRRRRKR